MQNAFLQKDGSRKRITDKIESDCHAAFTGCGQFFLHMSEIQNKIHRIQEE